jgi:hypothetical protein
MSIDEDTEWLDALAGRTAAEQSPREGAERTTDSAQSRALVLEARVLRELIRSQEPEIASTQPTTDAAREDELIRRAGADGLLPSPLAAPRAASSRTVRRPWFADTRAAFAAAAVLIAAVGIGLWQSMLPPTETMRGTVNGTVHLEARDPSALKRQLIEELTAAGVRVSGYERLGHIGIDADLPQPVAPAAAAVLERHHIPIPADGALMIEIDSAGSR